MEAQGWELTAVQWMEVGSENSWRRQQGCCTSFSSFFKLWTNLWDSCGNYNDIDKCGMLGGWRLILGDVGGKAECGEVLLFAYLFLERRNEECCLFYTYLRPTNCGISLPVNVCVNLHNLLSLPLNVCICLLKYKKECPCICALEITKVSSFPEDGDKW